MAARLSSSFAETEEPEIILQKAISRHGAVDVQYGLLHCHGNQEIFDSLNLAEGEMKCHNMAGRNLSFLDLR